MQYSREESREYLTPIYDLERLVSRISYQSANPRDLTGIEEFHGYASTNQISVSKI